MNNASTQNRPARISLPRPRLNAFLWKEMQTRMRGPRAHMLLTIYLAIAGALSMLLYIGAVVNNPRGQTGVGTVGTGVLVLLIGLQMVLVCFVTPAFAVSAISGERERQTFDLLRTTLISPLQIVLGKVTSSMGYTLLILFATIPLYSVAFLLGGIDLTQVVMALVIMLATALLFTMLGIFISSRMKSTIGAAILTYAIILGIVLGMPAVLLIGGPIVRALVTPTAATAGAATDITPALALAGLITVLFISISPITATLISQLSYQDTGSVWSVPQPYLTSTATTSGLSFPSPFIILIALYIVASLILLWLSVRRLSQADRV